MKKLTMIYWLLILSMVAMAQPVKYTIRADGTFDISGSAVTIKNCYPAINKIAIKPVRLKVTEKGASKTIQYVLLEGLFELNFSYDGTALVIKPTVTGTNSATDFISIFRDAEVTGANRVYRTPAQIMGNGGIINWPKDKTDFSSCASLTGLLPNTGATLVISTRDFKKYLSYTNVNPTDRNGGKKLIEACVSTEMVTPTNLPAFYFTENGSAFTAMQNEANAIGSFMNVKNDKKQTYHWCSWYYAYYYLTGNMLSEYLKGFNSLAPRVPLQTIQIDAGYHPHAGDWLEPGEKFPRGIAPSVKEIIDNNYKAGIWIGPYMVGNRSKTFLAHPDWILRKNDGRPIINMSFYGENRLWGAMDEEIYTLDTSNPDVMDYLRTVFRTFRKMGITFFKTDFMLYGAVSSNTVKRHTPGKTSTEYQRDFFDMVREEIGPESFWLACIAPYTSMLGYADGMRISADITPEWKGGNSMFTESKGAQHLNNTWWQNDPDAIILRSKYNGMNDDEATSLILWMGILGGMINTSDLFHQIPKERTELFRFLEPGDEKLNATFPFLGGEQKLEVMVKKYPSTNSFALLFINRSEAAVSETYSLKSLTGEAKGTCYEWNAEGHKIMGDQTEITIVLNPHQSKLVYFSIDGKSPAGINLGGKKL